MRKLKVFFLLLMSLSNGLLAKEDCADFIFQICSSNRGSSTNRYQVGFKVVGINGIITALHGVANYSSIRVYSCKDPNYSEEFKIKEVDFKNDAALLIPKRTTKTKFYSENGGIIPDTVTSITSKLMLHSKYYPIGVNTVIRESHMECCGPPHELQKELNNQQIKQVSIRNSPFATALIIPLDCPSKGGCSGSPLLIDNGKKDVKILGFLAGGDENSPLGFSYGHLLKELQFKGWYDKDVQEGLANLKQDVSGLFRASESEEKHESKNIPYSSNLFQSYMGQALEVVSKLDLYGCEKLKEYYRGLFSNPKPGRRDISKYSHLADEYPVIAYAIKTNYYVHCTSYVDEAIKAANQLKKKYDGVISKKEQRLIKKFYSYEAINNLVIETLADTVYANKLSVAKSLLKLNDYSNALKSAEEAYSLKSTAEAFEIISICKENIYDFGISKGDSLTSEKKFKEANYYYKIGLEVRPESNLLNSKIKANIRELRKSEGGVEQKSYITERLKSTFLNLQNLFSQEMPLPNINPDFEFSPTIPNDFIITFEYGMYDNSGSDEIFNMDFMKFNFPPGYPEYPGSEAAVNLLKATLTHILMDTVLNLSIDSIKFDITGWADGLKFRGKPKFDKYRYGNIDYGDYHIGFFDFNSQLALLRAASAREILKSSKLFHNENLFKLHSVVTDEVGGDKRKVVIKVNLFGVSLN